MSAQASLWEVIEDHALARVPAAQRRGWLALSWNTVGIVTTLIQLYVGALITFAAGPRVGLLAGITVVAGVVTLAVSYVLSHHILNGMIPVESLSAILISVILYPTLRCLVWPSD